MKTRSIKTLLTILLNEIKNKETIPSGLCGRINMLAVRNLISSEEWYKLKYFLDDNRPKRGKHFNSNRLLSSYYWDIGLVPPRVAWLEAKIKQH